MKYKIVCDFDGTITTQNISVLVLEKFAIGNWRQYEDDLENAEITIEECLNLQFAYVKTRKQEIISKIKTEILIREGLVELIQFARKNDVELIILSAGLDFIIDHVLNNLQIDIPIIAPESHFNDGISFTFPERNFKNSKDFKEDTIVKLQKEGIRIIFIGDGGSDYYGAMKANHVFAVKDRTLSKYLKIKNKANVIQFSSFKDIIKFVQRIIDNDDNQILG